MDWYVVLHDEYDLKCVKVHADSETEAVQRVLSAYGGWADTLRFRERPTGQVYSLEEIRQ